jgi:CheY-like chemotaxis protein
MPQGVDVDRPAPFVTLRDSGGLQIPVDNPHQTGGHVERRSLRGQGGGDEGASAMTRPRVLIADDHPIFAEGIRILLEPEFAVVSDACKLVAAAKEHLPEVIVADISMPSLYGIEAAALVRSAGLTAKIVFLTMYRDVACARRALEAGAVSHVLKHSVASELVTANRERPHSAKNSLSPEFELPTERTVEIGMREIRLHYAAGRAAAVERAAGGIAGVNSEPLRDEPACKTVGSERIPVCTGKPV